MARPTADQWLHALQVWQQPYVEYPGWRTRGRPGGLKDLVGLLEHHTGSNSKATPDYLFFLFEEGRPDDNIPGPLCQNAVGPDGVLHIGALGRANHAGEGSSLTLATVRNGAAPSNREMVPGPDNINGNDWYWGFEWLYDGLTPPSAALYAGALRSTAAFIWMMRQLTGLSSWGAGRVAGHKEHTRRKLDPGKVLMNKFRTDLAATLAAGPPQGDSMSAQDVTELKAFIHTEVFAGPRYEALQNASNAVIKIANEIDRQEDTRYARFEQVVTGFTQAMAQQKAEADTRQQALLNAIDGLTTALTAAKPQE